MWNLSESSSSGIKSAFWPGFRHCCLLLEAGALREGRISLHTQVWIGAKRGLAAEQPYCRQTFLERHTVVVMLLFFVLRISNSNVKISSKLSAETASVL